ncbi:MAG TPA: hypothetical protein VGG11_09590 [Xanthobacteraceae bacterium]
MRFLTQYSPINPLTGAPSPEMQAGMGAFMKQSVEAGVLVATGMVMPSAHNGMRMTLANGAFDVESGSSSAARQGGWAILDVASLDHLQAVVRQFLEVAGDGEVQVIEIMQVPLS